jgi:hypothetical protein
VTIGVRAHALLRRATRIVWAQMQTGAEVATPNLAAARRDQSFYRSLSVGSVRPLRALAGRFNHLVVAGNIAKSEVE